MGRDDRLVAFGMTRDGPHVEENLYIVPLLQIFTNIRERLPIELQFGFIEQNLQNLDDAGNRLLERAERFELLEPGLRDAAAGQANDREFGKSVETVNALVARLGVCEVEILQMVERLQCAQAMVVDRVAGEAQHFETVQAADRFQAGVGDASPRNIQLLQFG